jgi:membrane-associated phospholipid phosphatase
MAQLLSPLPKLTTNNATVAITPIQIPRYWYDPWVWGVPGGAILLMAVVYWGDWNQTIFLFFNGLSRFTGDALWSQLTLLGDTLIALCVAMLWLKSRADIVWSMVLAALLATLFVHSIKPLVDLPRPPAVLPPESLHLIGQMLHHHAFPSGHTTTIFTLVGVLVLQSQRNLLNFSLLLLACLVGISRCVVGVHWTLDVLAGMAGGWTAAWVGVWWARRWTWGRYHPRWLGGILSLCIIYLWMQPLDYPNTWLLQKLLASMCSFAAWRFWRDE